MNYGGIQQAFARLCLNAGISEIQLAEFAEFWRHPANSRESPPLWESMAGPRIDWAARAVLGCRRFYWSVLWAPSGSGGGVQMPRSAGGCWPAAPPPRGPIWGVTRGRATACLQVRWLQELKSSTAWVVHPVEAGGPSGGGAGGPCPGSGSPGPLMEGRLHVNSCRHLAHLPSGCVEQVFVAGQDLCFNVALVLL